MISRLACWLNGLWLTARTFPNNMIPFEGHEYEVEEEAVSALVTTMKCKCCGKYSVDWERL